MATNIHPEAMQTLVDKTNGNPFDVLGIHQITSKQIAIRAFRPNAKLLDVVDVQQGKLYPMERLSDEGFFEVVLEEDREAFTYQLHETTHTGEQHSFYDPYSFAPQLTEFDLQLLGEGRHFRSYDKLGAHLTEVNGVKGVHLAVWAPNAFRVGVAGLFNQWDSRTHTMLLHVDQGIWELFIPGLTEGDLYKFDIQSRNQGYSAEKTDPYGFAQEMRPKTASVIWNIDKHIWGDKDWIDRRKTANILEEPMNIYEVHLGSWKRKNGHEWLTYRELADELVGYAKALNYTHIELMPVAEHPFDGSWGYQVTGYFAPTSRYGTPDDFQYFVDQCHQNGLGVILDWVPAHFPKDGYALSYFDGTHLYEHEDSRLGEHPDWGTYIFNYGRNEVRNFLMSSAIFWMDKYHIDGLRVDAVSSMLYLDFSREDGEWVANVHGGNENLEAISFLKETNEIVHREFPGVAMVAEESTSWAMVSRPTYAGGLGFTFKWNMGWMHDTLDYISDDPVYRRYSHNKITFGLFYAFSENFILSLSHDEVVHGKASLISKIPGDDWQKFATMRLLFGHQIAHPGKILNFMGQEFGQRKEWSEERSLDWHLLDHKPHQQLHHWVRDMNHLYRSEPALYQVDFEPQGFEWIEADDVDNSVFTYLRLSRNREELIVVACNFTPVPRHNYSIGVPYEGYYAELINSDSEIYGGGNVGNLGGAHTISEASHGRPYRIEISLPPLAIVMFKYQPQ